VYCRLMIVVLLLANSVCVCGFVQVDVIVSPGTHVSETASKSNTSHVLLVKYSIYRVSEKKHPLILLAIS